MEVSAPTHCCMWGQGQCSLRCLAGRPVLVCGGEQAFVPDGVSGLPASSAPRLGPMRHKEDPLCCSWVPGSSSHISVFLYFLLPVQGKVCPLHLLDSRGLAAIPFPWKLRHSTVK